MRRGARGYVGGTAYRSGLLALGFTSRRPWIFEACFIPLCLALPIAAAGHAFCGLQFEIRRSRNRCLGFLEGYDRSRSRRMDSAQCTKLPFLRCAQRRLVGAPRARLISPRDKRQDRKRNWNGQRNHDRYLSHLRQPSTHCFATAITALNAALAGVSATASGLAGGPYYQFNPNAPESFANPLVDTHIFLTDNFVQSIQAGDLRSSTNTRRMLLERGRR